MTEVLPEGAKHRDTYVSYRFESQEKVDGPWQEIGFVVLDEAYARSMKAKLESDYAPDKYRVIKVTKMTFEKQEMLA